VDLEPAGDVHDPSRTRLRLAPAPRWRVRRLSNHRELAARRDTTHGANGDTRFAEERSDRGQHGCGGPPRFAGHQARRSRTTRPATALGHADCGAEPPYPLRGPPDSLPNTGVKLRSSNRVRLRQLQLLVGRHRYSSRNPLTLESRSGHVA